MRLLQFAVLKFYTFAFVKLLATGICLCYTTWFQDQACLSLSVSPTKRVASHCPVAALAQKTVTIYSAEDSGHGEQYTEEHGSTS